MNQTEQYPIRIAQIIGKLKAGGVEMVVYNYYRNLDHSRYQFDFIIDSDSEWTFPQELLNMGARYYVIPPYQKLPQHIIALIKLFRENRYQIVHSNMNSLAVFSLFAAWIAGVPVRICHSHSTAAPGETKKNILKYLLRPFAKVFPTHLCACSKLAGEWLYGKRAMEQGKVTVFNNAIDTEKFAFDPVVRAEVRREFGLDEETFVIGHVGRFCYQKNQEFLIDVFAEVHRQDPKAVLMLVGIGETMEMIREKVSHLGLSNSVIFTGARNDVHRLYQAMDVFVFPSRYEGLGMVAVEAQCSGIPVIASEAIPVEAKVCEDVTFLPLDSVSRWADTVTNVKSTMRVCQIAAQFDISFEALKLQYYYDFALQNK